MTSSLHPQTITLSSPPPPSGGLRYPLQLGGRLSRGLPQHRRRGLQRLLRPRPLGEVHGGGHAGHPARGAEHHGGRVGQSGLLRAAGTPPRQTYTPHKDTTRQTYSTRIMLMMHACLIFYYIYPPSTRHDITDTPTSSDPPSPPPSLSSSPRRAAVRRLSSGPARARVRYHPPAGVERGRCGYGCRPLCPPRHRTGGWVDGGFVS